VVENHQRQAACTVVLEPGAALFDVSAGTQVDFDLDEALGLLQDTWITEGVTLEFAAGLAPFRAEIDQQRSRAFARALTGYRKVFSPSRMRGLGLEIPHQHQRSQDRRRDAQSFSHPI